MNSEIFAQHVQHLAQEHRIEILHPVGITIDHAQAIKQYLRMLDRTEIAKSIAVPPVVDDVTYSTAMHELGHLIAPHACLPDLVGEITATQQIMHRLAQ